MRTYYVDGKEVYREELDQNLDIKQHAGRLPDGTVKEFFENGKIYFECEVKNGQRNGVCRIYFDNGKINIEKNYKTITLGKYITEIKKNAFKGFTNVTTITLNCDVPPTVDMEAFSGVTVDNITVNVPDALYSQYKSSTWASIFKHIVSPSNPTAVEEVSIESAKVVNMKILFGQEVEVEVYSITGAPIYKGIASEVSLPEKGIYIIRSGNKTKKVVCK